MTTATVQTIETPSYFRPGNNEGAADIPRGRLLKMGAAYQGVALATSSSDKPAGVSGELMEGTTNGVITRDRQIGGQAMVLSGAAISIGDDLTSDSTGRAITATDRNQSIWGKAQTAATGANQQVAMELSIGAVSASGGMQCLEMTIVAADLTDADTSQDFALGTIPSGSWITGYQCVPTELIAKGAQTFAMDVGYATAAEYIAANLNVGTGGSAGTPLEAAVSKATTADRAILVNITTNTGTLASCTAGNVTIRVFYMSPTALVVDPTP